MPDRIRTRRAAAASAWGSRVFPPEERRALYLQIERGLQAGIPLTSHLAQLEVLSHGRRRKELHKMMAIIVSGGQFYEAAFAARPLFPGSTPALLCAAERTGNIPVALDALATSLEFDIDVRNRVRKSLYYPLVLILSSVFLLPLPKLISCGTTAYLGAALTMLAPFALAGLLFAAIRLASLHPVFGARLRMIRDAIPWLGSAFRMKALAITLDTLGQGLSSGVSLFESLTIARTSAGSDDMTRLCDAALASVKAGGTLASSFGLDRALSDEIAVEIATGERTGNLPDALGESAKRLWKRYSDRVAIMVRVLGALVLAVVMTYAAISIIGAFSQILGLGASDGFNQEIQKEIPGIFQNL